MGGTEEAESQNREWKESWRDEYLKWICGFANAISDEQLLDQLGLIENEKLKKAAVLLFHRRPEKWAVGAYIKIGFFETDADIRFQDEVRGSLLIQADRVIDLMYLKYLKADISYEGVTRVETYPFPKAAVREAVYNAMIHSDYTTGVPIQISVYKDRLYITNDWLQPEGWDIRMMMGKHRSLQHNPNIANTFFRGGYIEAWGRGIEKMCRSCTDYGLPLPEYTLHPQDMMVCFRTKENDGINDGINLNPSEKAALQFIKEDPGITAAGVAEKLHVKVRQAERILSSLKEKKVLTRSGSRKNGIWQVIASDTDGERQHE